MSFRGIRLLGSAFNVFAIIQTCTYLCSSNFTQQVKELARNQSQIFNGESISRSTTHRQPYHLIQIEKNCLNKMIGLTMRNVA